MGVIEIIDALSKITGRPPKPPFPIPQPKDEKWKSPLEDHIQYIKEKKREKI